MKVVRNILFTIPWPKVPLSLPAPKRECGIFGPGTMKNHIRNMGINSQSICLPKPSARVAIYTCSGVANSLPPLLCNVLISTLKQVRNEKLEKYSFLP